ncbi:MAG: restriction endonuclease subunit S [Chromatiaceae bacterium]|nr:restriction endonuclease subunit S [Chromatiaceae bacterium]
MKTVPLGEVCEVVSGSTPKRNNPEYWGGEIPWVTPKELSKLETPYLEDSIEKITEMGYRSCSTTMLPPRSVLLSSRAPIGLLAINNKSVCTNQGFKSLVPSKEVHAEYLYYCLKANVERLQAKGNGATFKELSKTAVEEFKIPFPPLDDQKRIAHLLGKVEGLITQRKQHLQQLDDLLKSVFLEMFGDPVRNEKRFEVHQIGQLCDVKGGKRIPKGDKLVTENTGYPYIKAGNIKKGEITSNDIEFVTPETRRKISRYIVDEGDVCVTVVGVNIGDVGVVPKIFHKANLTENANKILIKDKAILDNQYLAYYLMSPYVQRQFALSIRAAGVPKLAIFRIEQINLLLPPPELQAKFSEIKSKIKHLSGQYQQSLVELENLYGTLSQKAFKGELDLSRVPLSDQSAPKVHEVKITDTATADDQVKFIEYPMSDPQARKSLLLNLFESYLNENEGQQLFLDDLWQHASWKTIDFMDESDKPWNIDDYEQLKEWVFERIRDGRLEQTFLDDANTVQLKVKG